MQANAAKTKKQIPNSRRNSTSSRGKRVEFLDKPILSSDGSSQVESSAGGDDDANLIANTQRMGKIWEKLKEPDPWPRQFAKTVRDRQEEVIQKLNEAKEKRASDRCAFEADFGSLISTALGGIGDTIASPSPLPIQVQFLGAEGQPYCDGMIDLMKQSGALLLAYDELSARQSHQSRVQEIGISFKKDKQVTTTTIAAGKKVAGVEIENLLADRFQEVRPPHVLTGDEEQRGRLLLSRGTGKETPQRQLLGWGNVARDTDRAIDRLSFAGHKRTRDH